MNLFERFAAWRAGRKADRDAIALALGEQRRAGDEAEPTLTETVEDANAFPSD